MAAVLGLLGAMAATPAVAAGYVTVTPTAVELGVVAPATTAQATVTVRASTNISIGTVVANRSAFYSGPYRIVNDGCSGRIVLSGQQCTFDVALQTSVTGEHVTDVYFNYNGPGATYGEYVPVHAVVASPPATPESFQATAGPGPGQVSLTWSAPISDGGSPVTTYKIERLEGSTWLPIAEPSAASLAYSETGLPDASSITYRLVASNAAGSSPWVLANATTWGPPSAPTGVTATKVRRPAGNYVTWSAPTSDGGTPVTGYDIYRNQRGGPLVLVASLSATDLAWFDANRLTREVMYAVAARNVVGLGEMSPLVAVQKA